MFTYLKASKRILFVIPIMSLIILSQTLQGQFMPGMPGAEGMGQADMPKGDTEPLQIPAGTIVGKGSYKPGAEAKLQAIPNPGYEFRHWESADMKISDPENPELSFTVDSHKKLKPVFERVWNVIAVAQPQEGGSVTGSGNYPKGSVAKLTAKANEGYTFKGWQGEGLTETQAEETELTVTGLHDLVAIFQNENDQNQDQQQQQQNQDPQQQDSQDKQGQQNQDQSQDQQDQQKQEQQENAASQEQEQEQQEKEQAKPESPEQEKEASKDPSDKESENETPPQPLYGMTREEALQILDALKEDEKKLPISLMEQSESKDDPSKGRDW